jgi:hypothetical protein
MADDSAGGAAPAKATDPKQESREIASPESKAVEAKKTTSFPAEILDALNKIPDQNAKAALSVALSRTTFGFGPDSETAKVIAQSEMHEEDCRLKAYQSSLVNREEQSKRDHEFRKKRLNHQTVLTTAILLVTIAGVGSGLALTVAGNSTIGNPVLIASFTMLSGLAGKLLSNREKD